MIAVVGLFSFFQSAHAQGFKNFARETQLGFEASFGIKTFSLTSSIAEINGMQVAEEGGSFGVIIGARALRLKVRQGYYYSSSSVMHTVDEARSAFVLNLYPIQMLLKSRSRLQPYVTGGIERNILKMYGTYGTESARITNYSVSEAPYLGRISSVIATVGAGMEYKVTNQKHFVNFFAEGRYGKPMQIESSNSMFANTKPTDQFIFNIGIGFGYSK